MDCKISILHILEVYYNGDLIINKDIIKNQVEIDKGGTLEFVLSENEGGSSLVPDLRCRTVAEVNSILPYSKLNLGQISKEGEVKDIASAYVVMQQPIADGDTKLPFGSSISITVSQSKPINCN